MQATDPARPVLSVIVISYNTRDMTLACLKSLYAQTSLPFETIVVDNASRDGSAVAIAAEFPQVRLLAETTNHGFAWANNLVAPLAQGAYLLLLNPDTVVLDHAVDRLMAFAQRRPEARIWGGRALFGDGTLNPGSCWGRMTLWGLLCQTSGLASVFRGSALFNPESYGGWDRRSERAVDIVSGCFLLIRQEDWQALKGFHPDFFMYGEEADLCLRARSVIGARPRITPDAEIIHYAGGSQPVLADRMVRLLKAKRGLILRHFPAWQRPLAEPIFTAWPLTRWLAAASAARLTGKEALHNRGRIWKEIWKRRNEWRVDLG